MKRIVSITALVFVMAGLTAGQDIPDIPKAINGGVLNGKAVKLPKPKYPDEAKSAKLEGTVRIKVTIDEEGNVASAEEATDESEVYHQTKSGEKVEKVTVAPADSLLSEAAKEAALEAKFAPTRLSGQPVKVTGVIVYNFLIGESDEYKSIPGSGSLNGKALALPPPAYPEAARVIKAQGTVTVQVLIDENGEVISAAAVSGHPLLRAAATEAARRAKFEATYLNGQPVKVSGVLTYNFVLP